MLCFLTVLALSPQRGCSTISQTTILCVRLLRFVLSSGISLDLTPPFCPVYYNLLSLSLSIICFLFYWQSHTLHVPFSSIYFHLVSFFSFEFVQVYVQLVPYSANLLELYLFPHPHMSIPLHVVLRDLLCKYACFSFFSYLHSDRIFLLYSSQPRQRSYLYTCHTYRIIAKHVVHYFDGTNSIDSLRNTSQSYYNIQKLSIRIFSLMELGIRTPERLPVRCVCVCACVCVRVRACVRACVCACVRAFVRM